MQNRSRLATVTHRAKNTADLSSLPQPFNNGGSMILKIILTILTIPLSIVVGLGCPENLRDGREILGGIFIFVFLNFIIWNC